MVNILLHSGKFLRPLTYIVKTLSPIGAKRKTEVADISLMLF